MKALVADDSPASRLLLNALLSTWGYDVVAVEDGDQALAALRAKDAPALAVLDWVMPGLDGPDVCRLVRAAPQDIRPYLILLTAKDSKEELAAGLDAGADDYVVKPFVPEELRARLGVGKRFVELYTELKAVENELTRQAQTDALTGALNRRAIMTELTLQVERARRENSFLSVAMLDIDRFKSINDTYGHASGDEVLVEVVRRISATVRPYDRMGRFGGEEFLLVMPGVNPADSAALADRVRRTVSATPITIGSTQAQVTISAGVAVYRDQPADVLLTQADDALYEAKRGGRNRVVLHASIASG